MDLGTIVDVAALIIGAWLLLGSILGPILGWAFRWAWLGTVWIVAFVHALIHLDLSDEEVSSVSVTSSAENAADGQTDSQTDQVFALIDAIEAKQLDRTRKEMIDTLASYGWGVGQVRALLKGDSGAIGAEVADAQQRLGILPLERTMRVRDHAGEREIAI